MSDVPTIDLTGSTDETASEQIEDIIKNSDPGIADQINQMMESNHTIENVINNYGQFTEDDYLNNITSADLDTIYQSIFQNSSQMVAYNPFIRLNALYSAITDNDINSNPNAAINEDTMALLYEIVYGAPMNYDDYKDFMAYGSTNALDTSANEIANISDNGTDTADFNSDNQYVDGFEQKVVDNTYTDEDYQRDTGSTSLPINPIISHSAPPYAINTITQLLQAPVGHIIPVEIATYFTSLRINSKHEVYYPNNDKWKRFTHDWWKKGFTPRLSNCAYEVLRHIISKATLAYNESSDNSIMYLLAQKRIYARHKCVYLLCRKTFLELYALCFAYEYPGALMDYCTAKDIKWLRKNIQYIERWLSHFGEYRDLIEPFRELDEAVGYLAPFFIKHISSSDLRYSEDKFNDNYINHSEK